MQASSLRCRVWQNYIRPGLDKTHSADRQLQVHVSMGTRDIFDNVNQLRIYSSASLVLVPIHNQTETCRFHLEGSGFLCGKDSALATHHAQ